MQVSLENLSVTYDGRSWALEELSLEIPSGSCFGLIGPNGAGKSTTLRALAGQCAPTTGRIVLDGTELGPDSRELCARVGFLGDQVPIYRAMTASQYLEFFARCHGQNRKRTRERARELLVDLRLEGKADVDCRSLSKGMRQRLTIGRAIVHDPRLLILDEPGDGLDPQGRVELRRLLRELHERGTTLIISSHILRELDELCDRVAVLARGRLTMAGPVTDIVRDYAVGRDLYRIELYHGDDSLSAGKRTSEGEPGCAPIGSEQSPCPVERCRRVLVDAGCTVEALDASASPAWLQAQIRGGDAQAARLLNELVAAKLPVCGLVRQRSSLEDIYGSLASDAVN